MKRRHFILTATTFLTSMFLPTACHYDAPEYDSTLAEPRLLSQIWDEKTILDIGSKYLSLTPKEEKERRLVRLLSQGLSPGKNDLPSALDEKIRQDFAKGNTVTIDGWIISLTEARQCALFTLNKPQK